MVSLFWLKRKASWYPAVKNKHGSQLLSSQMFMWKSPAVLIADKYLQLKWGMSHSVPICQTKQLSGTISVVINKAVNVIAIEELGVKQLFNINPGHCKTL